MQKYVRLVFSVNLFFLLMFSIGFAQAGTTQVAAASKPATPSQPALSTEQVRSLDLKFKTKTFLDKLTAVAKKINKTSPGKISVQNLQPLVSYQNKLAGNLALLSGLPQYTETTINVSGTVSNFISTMARQVNSGMPSIPSFSAPTNSNCASDYINCVRQSTATSSQCEDNCRQTTPPEGSSGGSHDGERSGCYYACWDSEDASDAACDQARAGCSDNKAANLSQKNVISETLAFLDQLTKLLDSLDYRNTIIPNAGSQDFRNEQSSQLAAHFNLIVNISRGMLPQNF